MEVFNRLRTVAALGLFLGLTACGGGGSGGSDPVPGRGPDTDTPSGETPQQSNSLNPGYPGVLYFSHYSQYSMFDLSSSLAFSMRTDGDATSAADGDNSFVTLYEDFEDDSYDHEKMDWFGLDGTTQHSFHVIEYLKGRPKISPDGQYLAVRHDPSGGTSGLTIFTRQGEPVAKFPDEDQHGPEFTSWDWKPDNSLIVAKGSQILQIEDWLNQQAPKSTVLKDLETGVPFELNLSPDQKQLSFNMKTADNNHHVFVLNLVTQEVGQVTQSNTSEFSSDWSPDGQHLAFRHGANYVMCDGWTCFSDCSTIFIAPATARMALVTEDERSEAHQVRQYLEGENHDICARSDVDWRAAPTPLPSRLGDAPAGSGLNQGLSGKLYYRKASHGLVYVDLENGSHQVIPSSEHPKGMSVADSEQELVFIRSYTENEGFDDHLLVTDMQGNVKETISIAEGLSGTAKISPNGRWIAVEWHNIDHGDDGGVPVVTVIERASVTNAQASIFIRHKGFDGWDWTPDNLLVLVRKTGVYVTDGNLANPEQWMTLPNNVEGLQVSPDGSQVAFKMLSHIWRANLSKSAEGTVQATQLTTSAREETSVTWSPDGNYLAVLYDTDCNEVHVVPANGERVYLDNTAAQSSSVELQWYDPEDGEQSRVCAFSEMDVSWVR